MTTWNSSLYLKFKEERTLPAKDLLHRIELEHPSRILDIGCGPGNSTRLLAQRYPCASILGIDSSENMIEAARRECPGIDFQLCDAQTGLAALGQDFDLVFSNACIQWIPDHRQLIPNMLSLLKPGGVLAVQMPVNQKEPIHQIIQRLAREERWRPRFPTPRIFYQLEEGEYFDLLAEHAADFSLWQITYCHRMESHQAILEWYRGTGLRPYLELLTKPEQEEFEAAVMARLKEAYPIQKNGEIIFRFPRLFFLAVR